MGLHCLEYKCHPNLDRKINMKNFKMIILMVCFFTFLPAYDKLVPSVVSIQWLKFHLNDPRIVIIDVRKESVFKKGHIKHAVNLPTFKYLFDKNYFIPKLSFLKEAFSKAGINDKSMVIVYGNDEPIWATTIGS